MMELLLIVAVLSAFAFAAGIAGHDSRPSIDDEPRRAI
jgi:hypothetical protein